jgi:hypothetical protein
MLRRPLESKALLEYTTFNNASFSSLYLYTLITYLNTIILILYSSPNYSPPNLLLPLTIPYFEPIALFKIKYLVAKVSANSCLGLDSILYPV